MVARGTGVRLADLAGDTLMFLTTTGCTVYSLDIADLAIKRAGNRAWLRRAASKDEAFKLRLEATKS
ncbi:hypothetical protein ATN84_22040 [Paramesorhizobium deserti]|uniref:Uncharacterized protein n=1 Tax=Paramesorhizobium deserti TaxID=1494590 RepID=A0A135HP78_9HYPH|nr:hypothetical protein ATN84_22040 [Paramesorhizobium deserti]